MQDQRLRDALDRNTLVFIVGTGYSAAATGSDPHATWRGLVESGIARAVELGSKPAWEVQARSNLAYGFDENDMDAILSSASRVQKELRNHGTYTFAKWLEETVGSLQVGDSTLGKRLRALHFPILTTNYDTLLESTDRRATDWTNPTEMQKVLAGSSRSIGHLHGVWSNPDSVIFSEQSYHTLLQSDAAQNLQRAASSLKSIVYVGFGAGLSDPNFSQMIHWHREHFIPSGVHHFRLCRDGELATLRTEHGNDHIIPVPYGADHADLAMFLSQFSQNVVELSSAGIARDIIGEAQTDFAEEMKVDAILGDTLDDVASRPLSEVILPPVLIPVPHSEYIKARSKKNEISIDRLDPSEEIKRGDILVIAAEENSGLTTAIKWMTLEASKYLPGAAPIYVPFQACRKRRNPIMEQVRTEAHQRQLISRRTDPLPPHVLGLDNFSPFVDYLSEAALGEIANTEALLTVIGCVQGVEDEIVDRFQRLGVKARICYLGKLSAADIRSYARLVSPSDSDNLAEQVLTMLRAENLAKTPFTVSLLLSVLVQGGKFSANASQTSVLDDYIGVLLGRGNPHEDARFGLDQSAREAILSVLAQVFVEAGVGGLTEIDVQKSFQVTFDKFGWSESTSEVLTNFVERRVLRRKGKHIEFARSSFLHLFAAKRATLDSGFRTLLLDRPVYYSDAITDYAALYRHDADLIERLGGLLEHEYTTPVPSGLFRTLALAAPRLNGDSDVARDDSDQDAAPRDQSDTQRAWGDEFFDAEDDSDLPPFPTAHESDVPPAIQLIRTLDLVSTVLRDSDQVEDLVLKEATLSSVLEKWALAMEMMHNDSYFFEHLKTYLVKEEKLSDDTPEKLEFLEEIRMIVPAAVTLGAVGGTLASRKLTRTLDRVLSKESATQSETVVLMACFFLFTLGEPGWPGKIASLLERQGNIWLVRNFLLHLFIQNFTDDVTTPSDADDLLDLCVSIVQRATTYSNDRERRVHRQEVLERIAKDRLRRRTSKKLSPTMLIEN